MGENILSQQRVFVGDSLYTVVRSLDWHDCWLGRQAAGCVAVGDFCNPCHSCGVIYAGVRVVLSKRDETMTERMSKEGAMENKILEAKGIKRTYSNGLIDVPALKKCDISIKKGEFVVVIGKSGSGKSTLLHVLAGLDEPDEGEVWIDGKNIVGMKEKEKAVFRRRNTGYVYQDYNLMPEFTSYENVVLPLRIDGKRENR